MKSIPSYLHILKYLVVVHLLCLLSLTLCRLILFITNIPAEGVDWQLLLTSLCIGIKFDNLIACYVSALPALLLPIWVLSTSHNPNYQKWLQYATSSVVWYYGIIYSLLLCVHIANARYYHFFENHINIGATAWFGFVGDTLGMIFGDTTNWWFILLACIVIALFLFALVAWTKSFLRRNYPVVTMRVNQYITSVVVLVLFWGLIFVGIRGSLQRYPLRVSFAYFCSKPFYNKIGVNPVFNFIKSAEHGTTQIPKEIAAIDEHEALDYVQNVLSIYPIDTLRPIVRPYEAKRMIEGKPNVVLIFMESMAAENLERQENGQWLTPYLRDLRNTSIYWENCYSTGIHTNNGIVGVHYGFVPNFSKPIMDVNADIYTGLPYYLKQNGYETVCFVTGNPQYDNMNSFWRDNHIDQIYSIYDYDPQAAVNNFGVNDGYMFDFGLQQLESRAQENKPFFASFLTVSNHGPFVVPDAYVGRAANPQEQIIAYADDAIKHFVESAQQTQWGENTLFILVADHGANLPCPYEMVLPYHKIPVYIFGAGITPSIVEQPTSQIDIWPTVLSMLGIDYNNNSLGIDILHNHRPYAFFVSDDYLGVSDGVYFWCYGIQTQRESLYRMGSGENILAYEPDRATEMRTFGMNMQRVNLMAIDNKWTEPCE